MDEVETVIDCPLGSRCRYSSEDDGKIHQCAWYVQVQGKNAAGEDNNRWGCAMEWMPIMQSGTTKGVLQLQSAVESTRNLQDIRQQEAIKVLGNGAT